MPGLEHPVSEMTKRSDADPYGCANQHREETVMVQDGWTEDGRRNMKEIDDFGSRECRYDHSLSARRCATCSKRGSGEKYSEMVRSKGR